MTKEKFSKWEAADVDSTFNPLDNMYYYRAKKKGALPETTKGFDSNSSAYLQERAYRSPLEAGLKDDSLRKVSETRQEYIQSVLDRSSNKNASALSPPKPELVKEKTLLKHASSVSTGMRSGTNTVHVAPELYSPLFLTQNLQLPRDIVTANAWNRAYYETNPIVRNAINLHATYPISKMTIKCKDKKVEKFFVDMMEKLDLETVVQYTALEFWKLGEVFVYASFDERTGTWDRLYHHNPDFISVKQSPIPGLSTISLRPDPELEKIITSPDPTHARIRESLDPRIVQHVLMNEYIPLDSFHISHLKNLSSPYDVRGTSVIVSVWKDLMLYDKLRESKFVQADGMINPLTLVKVGSSSPDGHYATHEELEMYREILEQAQFDKDFKLVTPDTVDIQRVGYSGAIVDTQSDFTMIIDNILMGLMVPKAVITQEGATYASASVALDVMRQRYNNFRTLMANWLEQKIFAPISEVQEFYEYEDGVKRLLVPQVEWNHMTLYDLDNYLGHILGLVDKKHVSLSTVYKSLGLTRENEHANIRAEAIQQAIMEKEAMELKTMTLSQLRALDPTKPIIEQAKPALPGVPGGPGGPPGAPPGMGEPSMTSPPGGGLDDLLGPPGGGGGGGPPPPDMGPPPGGDTPPTPPPGGGGAT